MFDRQQDYPTAVASKDDEGVNAAIRWCQEQAEPGDILSVWTHQKSNLQNSATLSSFVRQHRNVEHITGRGGATPSGPGPVLMAWPDMKDIGELTRFSYGIRALCVISWNEENLRPWVTAAGPVLLGDGSAWTDKTPGMHPILAEALKGLTLTVNHNNTIAAGYEKDQVVGVLLALAKGGIPMDAGAVEGWALANGWSGSNPTRLGQYVRDINAGKRPRSRNVICSDYVETLRRRTSSTGEGVE